MLDLEEALARVLAAFEPLELEQVPITEALGQVLAEDVVAEADNAPSEWRHPMDIPPLANTAMDGYAVRCDDTGGARPDHPRRLRVVADLAAGYVLEEPIRPGTAVRIMTGAPVPPGAEAVIPFEEVERDGDEILVFKRYPHNKNIRAAGEDVQEGQKVLWSGTVLRPQEIGMLAALGHSTVAVHRRPRVAILSTGDEVIGVGAPWQPGKIRDANSYSNAAQVVRYGGVPIRLGIARDDVNELTARIEAGLEQGADLFLTSGGVSVGDFDVVKEDPALNGTSARAGRDPGGCEPPASRGAGASGDAGLAGT